MFSLLIMSHIVNYIIILLVLINFISDNFKIFWDAGWPTGPNSLTIAKIRRERPFGYHAVLIKKGEGVGQHATSYSPPPIVP